MLECMKTNYSVHVHDNKKMCNTLAQWCVFKMFLDNNGC